MGAPPQPATLKEDVTKTITTYLKIVAFDQPSTLLSESLTTAIQLHCPAAAEVLLEPERATSATCHKAADALWKEIQKVPSSSGAPIVRLLAKAIVCVHGVGNHIDLAPLPAITWDDLPLLDWLISLGLPNLRENLGEALSTAARLQRMQHLQRLLSMPGGLWDGETLAGALAAAAALSDREAVKALLAAAARNFGHKSMLVRALEVVRNPAIAKQLLAAKVRTRWPWTSCDLASALAAAVQRGASQVLLLLVNATKWSPIYLSAQLVIAAQKGSEAVMRILLGGNFGSWQPCQLAPSLLAAARAKQWAAVIVLLESTAQRWTWSVLAPVILCSVEGGQVKVVQLLLQAMGDACLPHKLMPALLAAAGRGCLSITQQLLNAAATAWTASELYSAVKVAAKAALEEVEGAEAVLQELLVFRGKLWNFPELQDEVLAAAGGAAVGVLSLLLSRCRRSPAGSLQQLLLQAAALPQPEVLELILAAGYGWTAVDLALGMKIALGLQLQSNVRLLLSCPGVEWQTPVLAAFAAKAAEGGNGSLPSQLRLAASVGPCQAEQLEPGLLLAVQQGLDKVLLVAAVKAGHVQVVQQLLRSYPGTLQGQELRALVLMAITSGALPVVQLLLSVSPSTGRLGVSPSAASVANQGLGKQQLGSFRQLLALTPQLLPNELQGAVHAAVKQCWPAVVQVLLSAPSSVQWQVQDLLQPVLKAVYVRDERCLAAVLVAAAGQWRAEDLQGALAAAIRRGTLGAVRQLLCAAAGQWFKEELEGHVSEAAKGGHIMLWSLLQGACQ